MWSSYSVASRLVAGVPSESLAIPALLTLGSLVIARAKFPNPGALAPPSAAPDARLGAAYRWYLVGVGLIAAGLCDWALLSFHLGGDGVVPAHWLAFVYAAAMALMVTTLGLPARVVMGFTPKGSGDRVAIKGKDADAWVEVYFQGMGWRSFTPTPPETNVPKSSPPPPDDSDVSQQPVEPPM